MKNLILDFRLLFSGSNEHMHKTQKKKKKGRRMETRRRRPRRQCAFVCLYVMGGNGGSGKCSFNNIPLL